MQTHWLATAAVTFSSLAACVAGTVSLDWATDKEPVSYLPSEPITFKIQLVQDGKPLTGKTLKWLRTGDDQQSAHGEAVISERQPISITSSLNQPGFVRLEISLFNPDGSPLRDGENKPLKFEGGAGVQPTKIEGCPEPADFDAFWAAQKARLAQVPMKPRLTSVTTRNKNFEVFDVKVDCAGGKPVSGYLSLPKGAKAKSLPAQLAFRGYGVTGADQEFHDRTLTLQINAHGIENGREPAYYKGLQKDTLEGYAFSQPENAKPETAYFNGMMLRVLRALEFIKSRPEWDGKTLVVAGGSQGGLQAITAAALDSSVTKCYAYKPWCCDLAGTVRFGRLRGWRPEFTAGLGYYDTVNMAKRVHCQTCITAGLGDYTCPPSGVAVLYNNLSAPKTIEFIQGATHLYNPPNAQKQTLQSQSPITAPAQR